MGRVVVVGSVNADYVVRIVRLPQPGETVTGGRLTVHPGGKGANQAHAAARLGAPVTLIAAVGKDAAGEDERAALQAAAIDTSGLVQCDEPTGVAMILVDARGENMIAVASGANEMLTADMVCARLAGRLGEADLVLASLEIPLAAVQAAAAAAARAGAGMIINPAPGMPLPAELLRNAVLTPNQGEVRLMVPAAPDEQSAVGALLAAGAQAVVITRGSNGATLMRNRMRPTHFPAPQVRIVDTVGAGDAFNGALAVALAGRLSLEEGVAWAVAAGSVACTGAGARTALPRPEEVARLLRAGAGRPSPENLRRR